MIEVDGKAIALEPGKHYVILFDPRYSADGVVIALRDWLAREEIHAVVLPTLDPTSFRILHIEESEIVS